MPTSRSPTADPDRPFDYGSEAWGFESLRPCHRNPLWRMGFHLLASQLDDTWAAADRIWTARATLPVECHRKSLHIGREEVPLNGPS